MTLRMSTFSIGEGREKRENKNKKKNPLNTCELLSLIEPESGDSVWSKVSLTDCL